MRPTTAILLPVSLLSLAAPALAQAPAQAAAAASAAAQALEDLRPVQDLNYSKLRARLLTDGQILDP